MLSTVREWQTEITARLRAAMIADAAHEARLLLCYLLQTDTGGLLLKSNEPFPVDSDPLLERLLSRRLAGEPLQYLLGRWEFMGLPFKVKPCALIPRADTETLCETALDLIQNKTYETVLDLCCGTGCIGISVAKLAAAVVTLADIDGDWRKTRSLTVFPSRRLSRICLGILMSRLI